MMLRILSILSFSIFIVYTCAAQPILNRTIEVDDIFYFLDNKDKSIVYIGPSKVKLARDEKDRPAIKLLFQRYLGQNLNGKQGLIHQKCILQFRLEEEINTHSKLQKLKQKFGPKVTFIPMAYSTNLRLIYTPIEDEKSIIIGNTDADSVSQWQQKFITMTLSPLDGQLLEKQLLTGNTAMSIEVSLIATGLICEEKNNLIDFKTNNDTLYCNKINNHIVSTYPVTISIDSNYISDVIQKVDINAQKIPLEYAELEVRCYAFLDNENKNLLLRKIEIESEGVRANSVVKTSLSFSKNKKEEVVKTAKFNQIINAQNNFRYRITDIYENINEPKKSDWFSSKNWFQVLDISKI